MLVSQTDVPGSIPGLRILFFICPLDPLIFSQDSKKCTSELYRKVLKVAPFVVPLCVFVVCVFVVCFVCDPCAFLYGKNDHLGSKKKRTTRKGFEPSRQKTRP